MITPRLPRRAVMRHLDRLVDDLAPRQLQRLRLLADAIADDGRIPLDRALALATPGGDEQTAQATFRKFRAAVNEAIGETQVDLRLVTDGRKSAPQGRFCRFEGTDTADVELAQLSAKEARHRRSAGGADGGRGARRAAGHRVRQHRAAPARAGAPCPAGAPPGVGVRDAAPGPARPAPGPHVPRDDAFDIELGRDVAASRHALREQADVVLALVSAAYLRDSGSDGPWLAAARCRPVLVAMEQLPRGPLVDQGLPLAEVHLQTRPFSTRSRQAEKDDFVDECWVFVAKRLADGARAAGADLDLGTWLHGRLARDRGREHLVEPYVGETDLGEQLGARGGARPLGRRLPAVDRLAEWVTDRTAGATHLCALLGDVGMGKTTTTRLLTEHLLERRAADPSAPLPILFDLRDLPRSVATAGPNLRRIIEALLNATDVAGHRPSAGDVLDQVVGGNCVLIFDGLDEVLVHLDPHQGPMPLS